MSNILTHPLKIDILLPLHVDWTDRSSLSLYYIVAWPVLLRGYFLKVAYFSSELINLAQLTFQKLFNRFFFFLFSAYGNLTVRSLLDTREQCLNEFQFSDPYAIVSDAFDCYIVWWLVIQSWGHQFYNSAPDVAALFISRNILLEYCYMQGNAKDAIVAVRSFMTLLFISCIFNIF